MQKIHKGIIYKTENRRIYPNNFKVKFIYYKIVLTSYMLCIGLYSFSFIFIFILLISMRVV